MEGLSGSVSDPSFDFRSMEGAQNNLEQHIQPSSLPQSEFAQSEQLRHQGHYIEPQHKLSNDHPIAQQQHHSFTGEMGAPIHHYSQPRQKSPAPQSYSCLDTQASRPHDTISDRLTAQCQEKIQERLQAQYDGEKRAGGYHDKQKEKRKSSSGSSSSRNSIPSIGIRVRRDKHGQVITGSSHSSSSGKSREESIPAVTAYSQRKMQENGSYGQSQHGDGSMTGPSSPVLAFRSRSASLSQTNQAQMQMHYNQQHSTLQQQQELVPQQHMDFSSLSMSHGLPLSSPSENFSLDPIAKKSYDGMHVSERSTPAQSQPPSFGPHQPSFSQQSYDQGASQGIHSVFASPQSTAQYERSTDNTNTSSTMMPYHQTSSPFTNTNGAGSGSGSPFQINNSSGHPTPTFPSHHPTPPIFGAAPPSSLPPSTNHPSPVNFFHNQFSGHESVSYANSPVSSTNIAQHPQTLHHQPQPMQSQRNALMDMQLDRMEHSMMASIPGTPVYEKSQLQPLDSFDSKAGVVMSDMHDMGQHNISDQMDMSAGLGGGTIWGNRGAGASTLNVEHHHQQQQQQLHQRHQQDMASQNAFWNHNADLKFYQ